MTVFELLNFIIELGGCAYCSRHSLTSRLYFDLQPKIVRYLIEKNKTGLFLLHYIITYDINYLAKIMHFLFIT